MEYDARGIAGWTGPVGSILVTYRVRREEDQYVAECPELGVGTSGDTIDDAFSMIGDAVELHLNSLEEEGERERFFKEHNIVLFEDEAAPQSIACIPADLDEYVKRQVVPVHLFAYA